MVEVFQEPSMIHFIFYAVSLGAIYTALDHPEEVKKFLNLLEQNAEKVFVH